MVDTAILPPERAFGRSYWATLVPFPTVCFFGAFFTDLAYWAAPAEVQWETFSVWLLAVGLIVAGLTVVAGLVDLVRSFKIVGLRQRWLAVIAQLVTFGLELINVFVHSRDGYTAVVPEGLILSAVVALILVVVGLTARPVVYRSRVGVIS